MSAKDIKNCFGVLLDRANPVRAEKHGRPVVVSLEEVHRMSLAFDSPLGRAGR